MKRSLFSIISLLISILCIGFIVKINIDIADVYKSADGKTQALFGLVEMAFLYKYYCLFFCLVSLVMAFIAKRKEELNIMTRLALAFSIMSVIIVFIKIWKLII